MTKSNTETEEDGDRIIIKAINQINKLGLVTCQLCGYPFAAGDAVSVYAYRPAGESQYNIGHVICGDGTHTLPSYFTLGCRELILEGRVGVVVDVAALPDANARDKLASLCGLESPSPTAAENADATEPKHTDATQHDDVPTLSKATEETETTEAPSAAEEPTEPSASSAPKIAEEAEQPEEPKVPTAADESTTTNPGAAAELVLVAPAVRAVSGPKTTTARFRPPADATSFHLHSNSQSPARSSARCCVDDPNTDDANPLRNTDSTPRESVSWVYGETMCKRARDHDDNGSANGAGTTPQGPAPEEPSTPPTGRTESDTRGGEF